MIRPRQLSKATSSFLSPKMGRKWFLAFRFLIVVLLPILLISNLHSVACAEDLSLRKANAAIKEEFAVRVSILQKERSTEMDAAMFTMGSHTLRWLETAYGKPGKNGFPLWISLHGGGDVPASINEAQWKKQALIYQPENGIYVAPRSPTDTWFMWNECHVDPMLERLIENMILFRKVDPDRVYLLGYSAGGNGVYHLAPRMADRFAAAAAMAGYPSGAPLASLRNLPFAIFVGKHDITFDRVKEAETWRNEFSHQRKADPEGYYSWVKLYPNHGHWMGGEDAEALPWMARFTRQPWPKKIVWVQDSVPHPRLYWLEISSPDLPQARQLIATVKNQIITLQGDRPTWLRLWLSDQLVDLDKPVQVILNGELLYSAKINRSLSAIRTSLRARLDPSACATATLELSLGHPATPTPSGN